MHKHLIIWGLSRVRKLVENTQPRVLITLWFRGVLERLLRPLMRTLSLKKDTSQGDGGPPASSHSASSVVDASNVVSNTMMPPSPTCGPSKKEEWALEIGTWCVESGEVTFESRRPSSEETRCLAFLTSDRCFVEPRKITSGYEYRLSLKNFRVYRRKARFETGCPESVTAKVDFAIVYMHVGARDAPTCSLGCNLRARCKRVVFARWTNSARCLEE